MMTDEMARALNDPSASYWLKHTMLDAMKRDPVDSARDADILAAMLRRRADAVLRGQAAAGLYVVAGGLTE
jgi:rhamnogalacturonyl hydrolase YesR